MPRPFRILSLDGGGIMGACAASVLATFERETERRIVEHFDLIAGTSTGGIIAIALAMAPRRAEGSNLGRKRVRNVRTQPPTPPEGKIRGPSSS